MVQVYQQPIINVTPKDGELEIKLSITINLNSDGVQSLTVDELPKQKTKEKEADFIIPDFNSGMMLEFGKSITKEN